MKKFLMLALVFGMVGVVMAGEPTTKASKKSRAELPKVVQDYLAYRDEEYKSEVFSLQASIKSESQPFPKNMSFPSAAVRKEAEDKKKQNVEGWRAQLKKLQAIGESGYVPSFSLPLAKVGSGGNLGEFTVVQVLGEDSAIISQGGKTAIVRGVSFKDIADDDDIKLSTPVMATKTETYKTTSGASRTVLLLEPFDPQKYKDY